MKLEEKVTYPKTKAVNMLTQFCKHCQFCFALGQRIHDFHIWNIALVMVAAMIS